MKVISVENLGTSLPRFLVEVDDLGRLYLEVGLDSNELYVYQIDMTPWVWDFSKGDPFWMDDDEMDSLYASQQYALAVNRYNQP